MSLSKTDIEQLKKHGLTPENIQQQLKIFSEGIPFVKIVKAGSIGNGIESISEVDQNRLTWLKKLVPLQMNYYKKVGTVLIFVRKYKID